MAVGACFRIFLIYFIMSDANAGSFSHAGGFQQAPAPTPAADAGDGFMNIPDGIDEELPFN